MIPAATTASGLPWCLRHGDGRTALALTQTHGISELLAGVLAGRDIPIDDVPHFLNPTLRDYLPDPFHLLDMDKAVDRIVTAIEQKEPIAVFGDYDVDGATSTALLARFFAALDVTITPYIPDRLREGYGPNTAAFDTLIDAGTKLIITVDCGTLSHLPIAHAQARGVDVIVLDHHLSSGALPNAHAIVNPNRVDETSPHRHLAAVGVTFLLLVALNQRLRAAGYYADRIPPNLLGLLDLVALGTVCDVMPLTGLNRAFVAQGLKIMAQRRNLGLATLADVARLDALPNVYHLGFLLGPRINAGGRVGASGLGVELLTADNETQARSLAERLHTHNAERQAIESMVSEQAFALAERQANCPVVMVAGEGWHQGVIGIVAGRLKEKYSRPAIVIALDNGIGKASARSVTGADMGAAVHAAVSLGLLEAGGGHAMAAGFTLHADKCEALQEFFTTRMEAAVNAYQDARMLKFDGYLSASGAQAELLEELALAGPYGLGNPNPRFVLHGARLLHTAVMKEKHLRVTIGDASGTARLTAVCFNAIGSTLGQWLLQEKALHLLGELKLNSWQGRDTPQFLIDDAARIA